jgi:hypothetical protein
MKTKIKFFIGLVIIIICLIYGIILPVKNPDMTEMRLLISYWKEYLVMIAMLFIAQFLIRSSIKNS